MSEALKIEESKRELLMRTGIDKQLLFGQFYEKLDFCGITDKHRQNTNG